MQTTPPMTPPPAPIPPAPITPDEEEEDKEELEIDEQIIQSDETPPEPEPQPTFDFSGVRLEAAPEPPPPPPEPEEQEVIEWRDVAKGFIWNMPGSLWQEGIGMIEGIQNIPQMAQLAKELGFKLSSKPPPDMYAGQAAAVYGARLVDWLTGGDSAEKFEKEVHQYWERAENTPVETPMLDAVFDYYADNYGFGPDGIEGFKRFLRDDPAGFITDVLGVASLLAGTVAKGAKAASVAGKATKYNAKFEKFSKAAEKVDNFVNKGGTLLPGLNSPVMLKALDKILDMPFAPKVLEHVFDITRDPATRKIEFGMGLADVIDPGGLLVHGTLRSLQGIFRTEHPGLRERMMKAAEAWKIHNLPASAKTGDKALGSAEGAAAEAGDLDMIAQINKLNDEIDAAATKIASDIGDTENMGIAGDLAIKGFRKYVNDFLEKKDNLYNKWTKRDEIAEAVAETQPLRTILDDIKREATNPLGNRPVPPVIKELMENIDKDATYVNLKDKRAEIRDLMKSTDPIVKANEAWYMMVYQALSASMDATVIKVDPNLKKAIAEADLFYAEGINKINSAWGKRIFKSAGMLKKKWRMGGDFDLDSVPDASPEDLMTSIFSKDTDTSQIPLIYEMVGGFDSEAGMAMRGYFVNRLFSDARKGGRIKAKDAEGKEIEDVLAEAGDIGWNPAALITKINDFDRANPEKLAAFVGEEGANNLRLISQIIGSTSGYQRKASGSRTAPLMKMASYGLVTLADDLFHMVVGSGTNIDINKIAFAGAISGIGLITAVGKKEYQRWLTTKAGQNWLTHGYDRTAAGKFVKSISHWQGSAEWYKIYRFANQPLRDLMDAEVERGRHPQDLDERHHTLPQ